MKKSNALLNKEIDALKVERDSLAAAADALTAPTTNHMNIVLTPYKDALEISPIEKSLTNHQQCLNQDDAKKREMNIVITGTKEPVGDSDNGDKNTVK